MEPSTWRKVQKLAYPFTIFMLAQGLFLALGHALYLYPFDGMRLFETLYQGGATFMSDFAGYVASAWIGRGTARCLPRAEAEAQAQCQTPGPHGKNAPRDRIRAGLAESPP